ncbi:putative lipoprotein LppI [Mycobacterium ulcerans str. Harvey]|uniref:Lipoprotein LppI n=1 Tax=Mycobacterium ulcerans str. Harvey TaxID=1299332 RepID=A0ABN0QYG0_MYCUL|nr:putative lipoprotein LppI [Mycobacterium ulcerans str. Harvey]
MSHRARRRYRIQRQGGKVSCLTDTKHTGDAMACLVSLTNPSPPPHRLRRMEGRLGRF